MPRGPYKQYEHNPSVAVPKTTGFNRRKRRAIQVENDIEMDSIDENEDVTILSNTNGVQGSATDTIQVKHLAFIQGCKC